MKAVVIDVLSGHQIERHIRRDKDERKNKLRNEIFVSPEFEALWSKIKPKTTYRVEFTTDDLVSRAVAGIKKMSKIEAPKISVTTGALNVIKGGVDSRLIGAGFHEISPPTRSLPDVLAYLQNETELTRSTLVRILRESGRLAEMFVNPQRFLDQVSDILRFELHRLLVDGIKYEKIVGKEADAEWEQLLFKNEELVNFLTAQPVTKAPYEYVVYDSEIERAFAQGLESREDIRLFMKLPDWFKIDTPLGGYNPDWAILKQDSETIYLVRETKGTKDFLKLRTSEADKVRCGKAHFDALGVPFEVVVSATEV